MGHRYHINCRWARRAAAIVVTWLGAMHAQATLATIGVRATQGTGTPDPNATGGWTPRIVLPWITSESPADRMVVSSVGIDVLLGSENFGSRFGFSITYPPAQLPPEVPRLYRFSMTVHPNAGTNESYLESALPFLTLRHGCSTGDSEAPLQTRFQGLPGAGTQIVFSWVPLPFETCNVVIQIAEQSHEERPNWLSVDTFNISTAFP